MTRQTDIQENLAGIRARIAAAAEDARRPVDAVTLVAISKMFPAETVRLALAAGHRAFGENRVQEADAKWPALKAEFPDARLHLVGALQRNKAARAVRLFDVIETIDRAKLARAVAAGIKESGRDVTCLIQVNTGEEPQKGGVAPDDVDALVAECRSEIGLPIAGLMCIPPADEEPALHFALLAEIARRNGLDQLSMGMSADFETAVRLGATHVRVGTGVFGERAAEKPPLTPGVTPDPAASKAARG